MKHLAIILDGNRRWARAHNLPTLEGHRRGYENVKTIGLAALERGVEHFSVFAFSTENWKRSQEEVGYLMDLLFIALTKELDFYLEHDVRLNVIGRREGLSDRIIRAIEEVQVKTAGGTRGQFNLCMNYGGRAEIVEGVKKLIAQGVDPEAVDENLVATSLWTSDTPDPDMIVRTGGEQRLSGFLAWSGVYSELKFIDIHWPDFTIKDLDACLLGYEDRQRRFGQ